MRFVINHLQHVAQDTEDTMEALVILGCNTIRSVRLPGDTSHELGDKGEIENERARQEGILANIRHAMNRYKFTGLEHVGSSGCNLRDSLVAAHENFAVVLIQCALGISNGRHVLDDYSMIRVFSLLIQNGVGLHHVIDDIALTNLFAAEGLLLTQIPPICHKLATLKKKGGGWGRAYRCFLDGCKRQSK